MAFEHNGTFNRSQFNRFADFARAQLAMVPGRIAHLTAEQARVGALTMQISAGVPQGYSADPDSYIGKLLAAYEVLGGDAYYDLQIRLSSDPVFLLKGDETADAQVYSSGEIKSTQGLGDSVSSALVMSMRDWVDETIVYRRDRLERKIRRAMDYSDQLQAEIDRLTTITKSVDADSSLENIIAQVNHLIDDPTYRVIQDDQGKDPFGTLTYAPLASYEPGGDRGGIDGYGRTESGYVVPGEVPNKSKSGG